MDNNQLPPELFTSFVFPFVDTPMLNVCHYVCRSWHDNITSNPTTIDELYDYAAEHGNLPLLQWAHKHGYSWNKLTCIKAASNGSELMDAIGIYLRAQMLL